MQEFQFCEFQTLFMLLTAVASLRTKTVSTATSSNHSNDQLKNKISLNEARLVVTDGLRSTFLDEKV